MPYGINPKKQNWDTKSATPYFGLKRNTERDMTQSFKNKHLRIYDAFKSRQALFPPTPRCVAPQKVRVRIWLQDTNWKTQVKKVNSHQKPFEEETFENVSWIANDLIYRRAWATAERALQTAWDETVIQSCTQTHTGVHARRQEDRHTRTHIKQHAFLLLSHTQETNFVRRQQWLMHHVRWFHQPNVTLTYSDSSSC